MMEVNQNGLFSARGNHESENPPASAAGASDVQAPTPLSSLFPTGNPNLRDSRESLHFVDNNDAVELVSNLKMTAHQVQFMTDDGGSVSKEMTPARMHASNNPLSSTKTLLSEVSDDCILVETPKLSKQSRRRQNKKMRTIEEKIRNIQFSNSDASTSDSTNHNSSIASTQTVVCKVNLGTQIFEKR